MVGTRDRRQTWSSRTAKWRAGGRRVHLLGMSALLVTVGVAGCTSNVAVEPAWTTEPVAAVQQASFIEVRRAPGCGCCGGWEAYMRDQGFTVAGYEDPDIVQFKEDSGVPLAAQACHTAIIDGYVVEGHVPMAAIDDLLQQRPAIDGIALPGMPQGSPGMSGEQQAPFEVVAFSDGQVSPFGAY